MFMNITLKQLRAFAAIAQEQSFTRAAERLHVTQSALTAAIRMLENELDLRLFDRSTRAVTLTQQGQHFLPVAEKLLRDLSESLDDLKLLAERQRGAVTVSAAASFINYVLAPAVASLARRYPGIRVRLAEETTQGVIRMVTNGEADFGITTLVQQVPGLHAQLLLTDTYGVTCHKAHVLARAPAPLQWTDLAPYTMIGLYGANGIRSMLDRHPELDANFKNPPYEVNSMSCLPALLRQGFGYAVLPALTARPLVDNGFHFTPLVAPALQRQLFMVKKKDRSLTPAAQTLAEAMLDATATMTQDPYVAFTSTREEVRAFCY